MGALRGAKMTTNLAFALGSLLTWVGWTFLLISVWRFFSSNKKGGALAAGIGALSLLLGQVMTPWVGAQVRLPIFWPVLPFSGWVFATALVVLGVFCIRWFQSIGELEQNRHRNNVIAWVILSIASGIVFSKEANTVGMLRGSIPFSAGTFFGFVGLLVAALSTMSYISKWSAGRNASRVMVTHLALLAGSFIFAVPFAFLIITSFKEDRDMSNPNGIIWVPRVQQTVDYMNPKSPMYEATYEGQKVQGKIVADKGRTVTIDIARPFSIRGIVFEVEKSKIREIPVPARLVEVSYEGQTAKGFVAEDMQDGRAVVQFTEPESLRGKSAIFNPSDLIPVREVGLRWQNYSEALSFLPPESHNGLVYVKNSLLLVVFSVIGTLFSSSIVAFAFARMSFPGSKFLFGLMLSTMMLPGAVTLMPQFLIFRQLGWIDTLLPLWVPAFFGSAFNIFMLRQFFLGVPMELEDAAKIDGCSYFGSFWRVMLPQVKPALAVIAIWTFMGAWNNFMGPLIYTNSPENMPVSYAIQLFQGDRGAEPGLVMALTTLSVLPVLLVFFFAQKYFIEGVQLSGLGGR
jgi:multiple sugar transport system permease protein